MMLKTSYTVRYYNVLLLSVFLCITYPAKSLTNDSKDHKQNSKQDSLQDILKKSTQDTSKVIILEQLCDEFTDENPDKAIQYGEQGLNLAQKINYKSGIAYCLHLLGILNDNNGNYKIALEDFMKSSELYKQLGENIQMAKCFTSIGCIFYSQSNHAEALKFHQKSLKIYSQSGKKKEMAHCYINIGSIYLDQGLYPDAIAFFQKALKISEEIGDKLGMAASNANIGGVHYYQQTYDKALEYYSKALKLSEELSDKRGMAFCLNNIGNIYDSQKNFQRALIYFNASLRIREELGDKQGIASCYNNIGNINDEQGHYPLAMEYFNISLKLYDALGDTGWISVVYVNIAGLNNKLKRYNIAIDYAEKSLTLAKKIGELETVAQAYESLAKSYKSTNNFQKSLENFELYKQTNDSLFNSEKHKQLAQMEAIYQSEKKQKEIELKESQLTKKEVEYKQEKTQKFAFIIGFILMLILSGIILKSYRDKKRANYLLQKLNNDITLQKQEIEEKNVALNHQNEEIRAQRDEIEAQRDEIEAQRDLVTEQKDRIEEIHKQVTDSINYAKRIQEAVLPMSDIARSVLGEHFVFFKPKDIVSGDFYLIVKINNLLFVAVADCTGHGVPGAFMSMMGISFLNEIIQKQEINKANQILNDLRKEIIHALQQKGIQGEQKDGMDISLLIINTDTNECQWAGANNPLYIVKKSESEKLKVKSEELSTFDFQLYEFKGDKMPIAIYPDMKDFTNHVIKLSKGDSLYLFTDGLADQFGGIMNRKFMYKQFKETLLQITHKSMSEQKDILESTFENWKGKGEQIDDVTIIGIRI